MYFHRVLEENADTSDNEQTKQKKEVNRLMFTIRLMLKKNRYFLIKSLYYA